MPAYSNYDEELKTFAKALEGATLLTALDLMKRFGLSKPTVYARIKALRLQGYQFFVTSVRQSVSGPMAKAYKILKKPQP